MKKLTVLIGSSVETYRDEMNFFHKLEKRFKCKVKHTSKFKFSTVIGNWKVNFLFCYKPQKDKNYISSQKWWKKYKRRVTPSPASEVIKKIKKTDKILTLGICGAFSGKIDQVYLPYKVTKKDYKQEVIPFKSAISIKSKPMIFRNILIDKVNGKKSNHLTTNHTLMPGNLKGGKEDLVKLAKTLGKKFDSVDMELYVIVNAFKNKFPIGSLLFASDVLNKKKHHMNAFVNQMSRPLFVKNCFKAIEVMMK